MGGWMDGWMDRWVDGRMDGWMYGWIDAWMDGWMDGYMVKTIDIAVIHSSNYYLTYIINKVSNMWHLYNTTIDGIIPITHQITLSNMPSIITPLHMYII